MSADIRMVTCARHPAPDPDTPILADALRADGVRVDVADWRDDTVDWGDARLTLLRSPWDYVDAVDEFVAWTRAIGATTDLWNPAPLVAWNVHKSYLLDLHGRGAPVVPTVVLLHGMAASLDGVCDAQGWNTVVVKPAVGVGAYGAGRFDVGDPAGQSHLDALLDAGDALVQQFVAGVHDGELAVVCIACEVTHVVRKIPAPGDYRVQEQWGGRNELVDGEAGARELARRVVDVLPVTPMYARIDLLAGIDGWQVVEVEVTEPSLWLDLAPRAATERFVAALKARLAD